MYSMKVREEGFEEKQKLDHEGLVSHVKLLGMGKPSEDFKHREYLINFGFQDDHSGHNTENGLGENGGWELEQ